MRDLVVVVVTLAFFALCVAYVRWCDHIIGPDEVAEAPEEHDDVTEHVAA